MRLILILIYKFVLYHSLGFVFFSSLLFNFVHWTRFPSGLCKKKYSDETDNCCCHGVSSVALMTGKK